MENPIVTKQVLLNEIKLLNTFYEYLRTHQNDGVLEIIEEFCYENDIPVEEIGFLIAEDKFLKDYVENNLKKFKYVRDIKKSSELTEEF